MIRECRRKLSRRSYPCALRRRHESRLRACRRAHGRCARGRHGHPRGRGRPSSRDHHRRGSWTCRGRGGHSRAHGGRPCEESHRAHGEARCCGGEEIGHHEMGHRGRRESCGRHARCHARHGGGHGRSRSAMMPREVCVPTTRRQPRLLVICRANIPQSSTSHRGRCACCASRGKHRQHRGGSRTRRRRSWGRLAPGRYVQAGRHLQTRGSRARSRNVAADKATVP